MMNKIKYVSEIGLVKHLKKLMIPTSECVDRIRINNADDNDCMDDKLRRFF